jgi:hypothetical protein
MEWPCKIWQQKRSGLRFYVIYDKICREDISRRAGALARPIQVLDGPLFDSRHLLKRPRAMHNQGFDRPASVAEVSVNFKIHVQRVGFNLCESGLGAADWARVFWLGNERRLLKTHVLPFARRGFGAV